MTATATRELVASARERHTGILALNVIQLEHAEAILAAASQLEQPVILQISENAVAYHGALAPIAAACRAAIDLAPVAAALHLDHATSFELCREAAECGFDSVMIDASRLDWADNVALTAEVAHWCHGRSMWVEAELGEVGGKGAHASGARTDPDEAEQFVRATGIDGLAIAIGSSHAMRDRTATIDRELLHQIRQSVAVPLVLHGSSGLADHEILAAISGGITKINVGTQLNIALTGEVRASLAHDSQLIDPRRYLGRGRDAMTETVSALLQLIARA